MREFNQRIQELSREYQAEKLTLTPDQKKPTSVLGTFIQKFKSERNSNQNSIIQKKLNKIEFQIIIELMHQPGKYPLEYLRFSHENGGREPGFSYGFKCNLEGEEFETGYWNGNSEGISAKKQKHGLPAEIEIRDLKKNSLTLLYLPENYKIPVGPLSFDGDDSPMSQEEIDANRARAQTMAKTLDLKLNKNILNRANEMSPMQPIRKYPKRYFYWQPILSDKVEKIAIDFDNIDFHHMGLSLENAPTFNKTIIVKQQ
jgi:hypothetical protein